MRSIAAMRIFNSLLLACCALLGACSSGLRDEQIRSDFLALQKKGQIAQSGEITKIVKGDGWSDGAEIRVYFCSHQQSQFTQCDETYVELSYQKYADGWRLISAVPKRIAPQP